MLRSNTAISSPVMRSRKWNSGADMPPLGASEKASSSSPSSTSIPTVGGCTVAARWSSAASDSCSSSVTGMPFRVSARPITAPTGPAPTTITGAGCRCTSHLRNLEHRGMEQLLDRDLAVDQALLMRILRERRNLPHVLVDAVGPEILTHGGDGRLRLRD